MESKHKNDLSAMKNKVKELNMKFSDSQNETLKLKAENYNFKTEIQQQQKEIDQL